MNCIVGNALNDFSGGGFIAAAERADADPFVAVFALAVVIGVTGTFVAGRTAEVSAGAAGSSP